MPFRKLASEARGSYTVQPVQEIIDELVQLGYLLFVGEEWIRTRKPYTDEMRRELARYAQQRRNLVVDPHLPVNIVRKDVEPWEARLFGYPTEPVFLTGRIFRLKG